MIYSCDLESTGLLDDLKEQGDEAKLWNFAAKAEDGHEILFTRAETNPNLCNDIRPISELQEWLNKGNTLVIHNGITYDGEAMEFFGYDMSNNFIIDTLYISWYIDPKRNRYGLAEYGEKFGVEKPKIDNWEGLSQDEYNWRVLQDIRIQKKLWDYLSGALFELYEGSEAKVNELINYLMIKGKHLRAAQRSKWKLNEHQAKVYSVEWNKEKDVRFDGLVDVMPLMPTYKEARKPKKPFKMNGQISGKLTLEGEASLGCKWLMFCLHYGVEWDSNETYEYLDGTVAGNPNSPAQVKNWLFDLGWEPETFVYKKDDDGNERKIPQVNKPKSGGRLDPGVERLLHDNRDLKHLEGLGIIKHRVSVVDGWLDTAVDGYILARASGFTNTLRLKHSGIVNVPSTRVPFGKELRSLLVSEEGYESLGSDLSSLEDRVKHHYQMPFDPEYVKQQMHEDFDPHLTIACMGGFLSKEEMKEHIDGTVDHSNVRSLGKATNYSCQYGAYPPTIARAAGIDILSAKALWEAYWELNWSINEISEGTETKACNGVNWQRNPVNGFWYYLKTKKDRFSTLCQGTGSYVFDMWVEEIFKICDERWSREPTLSGQFHDEVILQTKLGTRHIWEEVLATAMERTNKLLGMRRDMACDVQFDTNYAGIH